MARIELRYCTIRMKDGLAGTAAVNQPVTPPLSGDASLTINNVVLNTDVTDKVPVGARFTLAGEDVDTVHVVTARTPSSGNPTTVITFSPALGMGTYTGSTAGVVGAATTSQAGDVSHNEVQAIARFVNNVTGGHFTITLNLFGAAPITTASILFSANAATILAAINTAVTGASYPAWTNGDIVVGGGPLTSAGITLTYSGTSVTDVNQGQATIASVDLTATVGNTVLTFSPQQIDVKIGDGELKYTVNTQYKYDLDRGLLDTVRKGDDQPMDVSLAFTYEHITTGTNELIAPMDAAYRRGGATEWVNAAADPCEPFAVDIEIIHTPPCGTSQIESTTFPDFRVEKAEPDFKNSIITITGKSHAVEPIFARIDQ